MASSESNREGQGSGPLPEDVAGQNILGDLRVSELLNTGSNMFEQALRQPATVATEIAAFFSELGRIACGVSTVAAPTDKRFADPAWSESTFYKKMLQGYAAWSQSLQSYGDNAGLDPKETGRAKFLLSQISDALAPTNFLFGNPAALKRAIESGGKSLLDGYQNLLSDAAAQKPLPSQVDDRPFKVGETIAATPGDVVLRTEMFELLQYRPQTEQVRERPILVVPSVINKYYAFDLAPGRSLLEYLVKNGFTVFTMVFRNPGREHDSWGMEAYMDAMDAAIDAVRDIRGIEDPHLWVVCGAGPLLASLAGYYAAMNQTKIGSLTLFVSPLDTGGINKTPVLGDFMDQKLIGLADRLPGKNDRISADEFALLFAMLRPNDLIWNYWVNNYLMGNDPPAFDILAWNADGTGMTAQFNRDFRAFADRNPLVTPGEMTVKGTPIADIAAFNFDSYVIGARTDHICPWPTVYRSAQMLGERCTFLLGGSGHIQTIVSPPGSSKAHYFLNADKSKDAEDWLASATKVPGTWWDHFAAWGHERSGAFVPAPTTAGNANHLSLGPAPGSYVLERASRS